MGQASSQLAQALSGMQRLCLTLKSSQAYPPGYGLFVGKRRKNLKPVDFDLESCESWECGMAAHSRSRDSADGIRPYDDGSFDAPDWSDADLAPVALHVSQRL